MLLNRFEGSIGTSKKTDTPVATRASLYAQSLVKVKEKVKMGMQAEFPILMMMGESMVNTFADATIKPIADEVIAAQKKYDDARSSNNLIALNIADMLLKQAKQDAKTLGDHAKLTTSILAAEAATGQLQVVEQLLLPLQFVNYISSTARNIIPTEVVDNEIFIRQRQVKIGMVTGDTTEYRFPEALKNKEFLSKVLMADNNAKVVSIDVAVNPSSQPVDLLSLMGPGFSAGKDKINPQLFIKKLYIADAGTKADGTTPIGTVECALREDYNVTADMQKKGDVNLIGKVTGKYTDTVDNKPVVITKEYPVKLSGQVDFEKGTLEYHHTSNIVKFDIALSIYAGSFGRGVRTKEIKEQFHYHVKNHIQGSFAWNFREQIQKMNFEHTDMIVMAAEQMGEIFDAAKDQFQFTKLDEAWDELRELKSRNLLNSQELADQVTADLSPDPTKVAVVTDNPDGLRNRMINEAASKLMLSAKTKFQPKAGFCTNMWTNLEISRIYGPEEIMSGDTYAGVSGVTPIRGGSIKGYQFKLVETAREDMDSNTIKMTPFFNDANMETFKFLQWETKRFDDNSYREPSKPNQPSFHVVDFFDFVGIAKPLMQLKITNKDKLMSVGEID